MHVMDLYEELYATELVYQAGCWKLCGDAHCCNFARYRNKFRMLAKNSAQDLPLLPGEFEFLSAKGWDRQFHGFTRQVRPYEFGTGIVYVDMISSKRAGCACDHLTRTIVCRFYPLLPVFDLDGRVVGVESLGMYEELERLDGLAPACQISGLPFNQLNLFLRMCYLLAANPALLFHLMAYRLAKHHVFDRLASQKSAAGDSAFATFEGAFFGRQLFDHAQLRQELAALKCKIEQRYGGGFEREMKQLQSGYHCIA